MRKLALKWWRDLTDEQRLEEIKNWKANTGDWRRHYDSSLILKDEGTIEAIFLFKRTQI